MIKVHYAVTNGMAFIGLCGQRLSTHIQSTKVKEQVSCKGCLAKLKKEVKA